jgi:UDP-glucose 4-epimerase
VNDTPILVTGGAGYIGSHAVLALLDAGFRPVVLDDLSTGNPALVPDGVPLVRGNVGDRARVVDTLKRFDVRAVLHFAGSIIVPESVERPLDYYRNNTANSLSLFQGCLDAGVDKVIFSSTAAVYGQPEQVPVTEETRPAPINPYGASKLMTEQMLADADPAHGLRSVVLRYFNVAGADPQMRTGQMSATTTHLIRAACETALGRRARLDVFGTDYPTADGTCVRDFIHVSDLAEAHVLALRHLLDGGPSLVLNCGYGRGYSVRDVVSAIQGITGRPLPVREAPRRAGDPPSVVADNSKIRELLGWRARHDDLRTIIATSLEWQRRLPSHAA